MKEKDALAWQKRRDAGLVRWILVRWILGLSLPISLGIVLPRWLGDPDSGGYLLFVGVVPPPIVGGVLAGLATWYLLQYQYRRYPAQKAGPVQHSPDPSQSI